MGARQAEIVVAHAQGHGVPRGPAGQIAPEKPAAVAAARAEELERKLGGSRGGAHSDLMCQAPGPAPQRVVLGSGRAGAWHERERVQHRAVLGDGTKLDRPRLDIHATEVVAPGFRLGEDGRIPIEPDELRAGAAGDDIGNAVLLRALVHVPARKHEVDATAAHQRRPDTPQELGGAAPADVDGIVDEEHAEGRAPDLVACELLPQPA
ncbi:MAG: hypothetical protein HY744_23585, partial [Deltaproteobacteria bacterium]|nr:hypothetical protein [Deltaproteobacteria bacterium]